MSSVSPVKTKPGLPIGTKNQQQQQQQQQRSQYLHPDYLEEPTGLTDPKQSPLALLVKTCDSIGRGNINGPGCVDAAAEAASDSKPHHLVTAGSWSTSRRSNGGGSRPTSAFDSGAPTLKRAASPPRDCARDDKLGQPRPAKQRSPPTPSQNLAKSPESPTGLAAVSTAPTAAAVAAAMAAMAGVLPHQQHSISSSPLTYPPVFPPFHHHQQQQQQQQQQLAAAAAAAWGFGGVPDGHSAAVCACPHCVHARALVDYLYASAAAAAAAASAGSTVSTASGPIASTSSSSSSSIQQHRRQHSPTIQPVQTPQAEFCIFCGKHCPTPDQLVRHMRSHESSAANIGPQLSPFSGPASPPPPPPLSQMTLPPNVPSHHHASLAYAAAAAAAMQQQQQQQPQQQQQLESMRKWAAAAAAAASDQRYHPYRSLLGRLQFPHFGTAPLV